MQVKLHQTASARVFSSEKARIFKGRQTASARGQIERKRALAKLHQSARRLRSRPKIKLHQRANVWSAGTVNKVFNQQG